MPTLPAARDALDLDLDDLLPRDADGASLIARQPAIALDADNTIALNSLTERSHFKRQNQQQQQIVPGIIPTYYVIDGPAAGTVVGITLGSVAGFLLLIWLFYSLANINGTAAGATIAGEEEIVVRRPRNSHSNRSRRSTRTEVREYSRSPRRRSQPIIVEERRQPQRSRARSFVVEERSSRSRSRVPGDDVVEVIEEHDDYRSRRGTRRY